MSTIYQICDYGPVEMLQGAMKASDKIENPSIMFFIPAESSVIPGTSAPSSNSMLTLYPTTILGEKESDELFKNFSKQDGHGLKNGQKLPIEFSTDDETLRCAIVMGGQGCEEDIKKYLNKIKQEHQELGENAPRMQALVACGNNKELYEKLNKEYSDTHGSDLEIVPVGFVDNKHLLAFEKNSVLISKPGGGTMSECVQNGIQTCVAYNPDMPWEKGNADELVNTGYGAFVKDEESLIGQIQERNQRRIEQKAQSKGQKENTKQEATTHLSRLLTERQNEQNKGII